MATLAPGLGYTRLLSGGRADISRIPAFEGRFDEGDEGLLQLRLRLIPAGTDTALRLFAAGLRQGGVALPRDPYVSGDTINIPFRKALPPLALIVGALLGAWLLLLVSFSLFKKTGGFLGVPSWAWTVMVVLALLILLGLVALVVMGKAQRLAGLT